MLEELVANKSRFLLAKLQLDWLEKQATRSRRALELAIPRLPDSRDSIYDDALDRINRQDQDDKKIGCRVLTWVSQSPEPLTIKQLQFAVLIEPGNTHIDVRLLDTPEYILSKCAGLVQVDDTSKIVRFAHGTVYDYFIRKPTQLGNDTSMLALSCLAYLLSEAFLTDTFDVPDAARLNQIHSNSHDLQQSGPGNFAKSMSKTDAEIFHFRSSHPFSTYAVSKMALLARGVVSRTVQEWVEKLFRDEVRLWKYHDVRRWLSFYLHLREPFPDAERNRLRFAIELDLPMVVTWLLKEQQSGKTRNPLSQSGGIFSSDSAMKNLVFPIVTDHEELNRHGATTPCRQLDVALHFAAFRGRDNTVKHLLENGADINALLTPIILAGSGFEITVPVAPPSEQVWYSPLSQAVSGDHGSTVNVLLDMEAVLDLEANDHRVTKHPLQLAVEQQKLPIVESFLQRGADVNKRFRRGNTALHYAVQQSSSSCLKMLLGYGATVDSMNDDRQSPLYLAVSSNNEEAVASLVSFGARPETLLDCNDPSGLITRVYSSVSPRNESFLRDLLLFFSERQIILDANLAVDHFSALLDPRGEPESEPHKPRFFSRLDHQRQRFQRWTEKEEISFSGLTSRIGRVWGSSDIQMGKQLLFELREALDAGNSIS